MSEQTLKLITPLMHGPDVTAFQAALEARFKGWSIDRTLDEDGAYGPDTDHAARQVCHGLGLDPAGYADGITPDAQAKIADPAKRSPEDEARDKEAAPWRDALRKACAGGGAGAALAIAWATSKIGVAEHPPGSNRGPEVDLWNRAVNTPPGPMAYWCGAFVNAALHAAGFANEPFLAYCPNIETHARQGAGGWSWIPDWRTGHPGDLVLYMEGGNPLPAHVELLVSAEPFVVIGGNTSPTAGMGSQADGGCVAEHRDRNPETPGFKVKGLARPPWR